MSAHNPENNSLPKISIVIVNFNQALLLKHCLISLKKSNYPPQKIKIFIIDNGSSDNSIKIVREIYPSSIIIANKTNLGFAKANNQGICEALKIKKNKYVITLNNDTEVRQNSVKELVKFMETHPKTGICTGKILQLYKKSRIDSAGDFFSKENLRMFNRGHSERDEGQYDKSQEVLSACAAFSIFRSETLYDVRMGNEWFDEDFESYLEDIDLNIRAKLKGWKSWYVPRATIYHLGSATSSKISPYLKEFLSRRNRLLLVVKTMPIKMVLVFIFKYLFPSKIGIQYYLTKKYKRIKRKGVIFYVNKYSRNSNNKINKVSNRLSIGTIMVLNLLSTISAIMLLPKMVKKRKLIKDSQTVKNLEIYSWVEKLSIRTIPSIFS